MPTTTIADIDLAYETHGPAEGPPLLLIAGLGMQLIDWPGHIVDPLAEQHQVIRFDNRDIGLSTRFDGAPADPGALMAALLEGAPAELAYSLDDLAADAVGLLDCLGLDSAHIVGLSMGGMIAQTLAIAHPDRVRSLTSIMSTTGSPDVGQPSAAALEAIMSTPPAATRQAHIDHGVETMRVWASPDHYDPDEIRRLLGASWDRAGGAQTEGTARQLCSIIAGPVRDAALGGLDLPALVIHGSADTLIDPSGGQRTAASISGAELLMIDGMGHDMPKAMADQIVTAIAGHVATADQAGRAA